MKLSTVVLVLLSVAGLAGAGAYVWRVRERSVEWKKLIRYACWKDCLRKDDYEEFFDIARRSVPDEPHSAEVLRTLAVQPPGSSLKILILVRDSGQPDEVRVHRFNEDRDYLGRTVLPCGNPGGTLECARAVDSELPGATFVIQLSQNQYQYYALQGNDLVLILLGDIRGKTPSNDYVTPGRRVGPPIPENALNRCEAMLSSSDPVNILQALTWLHGRHPDGAGWSALRKRPAVERRIAELAKSETYAIAKVAQALLPTEHPASQSDR
jgi:hypothetical protein